MPENEDEHHPDQITDAEVADIVAGMITDEDLRARSEALNNAQETWEEIAYLANPKMPCPECTGAGQVAGGSLGDICVRCLGARVIEQPGSVRVEMPPFAELRAAITAYGDALADRQLPPGHKGKRNLALPAGATVPTLDAIAEIHRTALDKAKQLTHGPGLVSQAMLPAPKPEKGMRSEGDLSEHDDAELDEMETESTGKKPTAGKPMFKRPIPKKGRRK